MTIPITTDTTATSERAPIYLDYAATTPTDPRVVDCFGAAHELGFTIAWREGQLSIAPAPDPR